jgi:DNA polymerase-4
MDAFYASVEQRDRPELRGQPVVVGGRPEERGVVAAASYEARAFGVRSALSMAKAVRLCPTLTIVRPAFKKYRAVSAQVFDLFRTVTPLVEPLSLDEAYLDVTENAWGEQLASQVARQLKRQILKATGLTASAGVAPNKFIAKIASGWRKPDGLTVVPHERVEAFLKRLPVEALWGVGPVTGKRLRAHGVLKLVDIRSVDDDLFRRLVGKKAVLFRRLAYGDDDRPVVPNRAAKSCGSENTYASNLVDLERIRKEVDQLARRAASWLEDKHLWARTVTVKVRYSDFTTVTRSQTGALPTRDAAAIAERAVGLLGRTDAGARPIRLLGTSVHNLTDTNQPPGLKTAGMLQLWDTPAGSPDIRS